MPPLPPRAQPPPANTAAILAQLHAAPGWPRAAALAPNPNTPDPSATDPTTLTALLQAASHFADRHLQPLNHAMDQVGCQLHEGRVHTAPTHIQAWNAFAADGWTSLGQPPNHGGQPLPLSVWAAAQSLFDRACPAFAMIPVPLLAGARLLAAWASPAIQAEWLPQLVAGAWTATICISEPDAGSDLAAIRTLATPDGQGGWTITGDKCWISFGDHDLSPRIGHLLLARTAGAPAGTAGLSLFLVPDRMADGTRNGVTPHRLEAKMGLHGSPTCALGFDAAQAQLIGTQGRGLAQMFVMIGTMRLAVAIQGLGVASQCTDIAQAYAHQRRQGTSIGSPTPVPIATHPDVQRMLAEMHATTTTLRGLIFALANQLDLAAREPDPAARTDAAALCEWLLPIVKTAGAEAGFTVANLALQVLGGAGYTSDWPVEQAVRDSRVFAIFEGTSGIQALDLLHRRLRRTDATGLAVFLRTASAAADAAGPPGAALHLCLAALHRTATALRAQPVPAAEAGATALLSLAILAAQGWIAATLCAPALTPNPTTTALQAAARYTLARIAPRAALLEREAIDADSALRHFTPPTQPNTTPPDRARAPIPATA